MAAADARRVIKNALHRIYFVIKSTATLQAITGGLTGLAATVDKDGAGFAAASGTPTEIGTTGYGYLDLTVSEMTADHIAVKVTATNANAFAYDVFLHPEEALDSGALAAGGSSTVTLASTAVATTSYYIGSTIEIVRGTGLGQVRTITAYNSSRQATVDRAFTTSPATNDTYVIRPQQEGTYGTDILAQVNVTKLNSDATSASNLQKLYEGIGQFSTTTGTPSTTSIPGTGLSSTDDTYNNCVFVITDSAAPVTIRGVARKISDYVGSTGTLTLASALVAAPAAGIEFVILGRIE